LHARAEWFVNFEKRQANPWGYYGFAEGWVKFLGVLPQRAANARPYYAVTTKIL